MRILFLSALYSTPRRPGRGVGNARILHAMRRHADVRVMAPVSWYPPLLRNHPSARADAETPVRDRDDDGSTVLHPRTLHVPRVGRSLYAGLYAASVFAPLLAEVRRFRPDVLLSAWAYPDGTAAAALGALLRLPTVVRIMGSDINTIARLPGRRGQITWAMRQVDRVIAVSRALAREVEALGTRADRVSVIPTGVDQTIFHPHDRAEARREVGAAGDEQVVVVPGRLSPEKGVHHFVDAMARLGDGARVRALIVGDGQDAAALAEQAKRLGLGERITFAGFQPERRMPIYYTAADLVCLPSLEEGWPDVLMEAFACGCPVVASDVGGVPEIIDLTGGGMLARPGDPDGLARVLREALARRWDREALARAMAPYDLDATARHYVDACAQAGERG
ncbi:MAG TPA: glycosyltransferase [Kofleriaceae bacterium]|nr:glycosyltransferase [Kofleriaceae bacterium]